LTHAFETWLFRYYGKKISTPMKQSSLLNDLIDLRNQSWSSFAGSFCKLNLNYCPVVIVILSSWQKLRVNLLRIFLKGWCLSKQLMIFQQRRFLEPARENWRCSRCCKSHHIFVLRHWHPGKISFSVCQRIVWFLHERPNTIRVLPNGRGSVTINRALDGSTFPG